MDDPERHVLIVENDDQVRQILSRVVQNMGQCAVSVGSVSEALAHMKSNSVDLILLDLRMPAVHGEDFLDFIRKQGNRIPVIVVSGYLDRENIPRLMRAGVSGIIVKPFTRDRIVSEIRSALEL